MGHSSNYAVVIAQLYTNGECHGVQPFIVQLRDEETWKPMKGIIIGEIGPKMGMKSVNNGYLAFDNVRIPRKNMLMQNAQVLEDGTFVRGKASVLTYGTLIFVRTIIVRDVLSFLAKAVTIVTRYSAVRRQSPIDPTKPEPQVIDHLTQQNKVFPNIARCLVYKLLADYSWEMYNRITSEMKKGVFDRLPEVCNVLGVFSLHLIIIVCFNFQLHAVICLLKAMCTADSTEAVETLRLACGGHGYMESSNLPSIYTMLSAACTYDGENTVMYLQTARYGKFLNALLYED